MLQNPESGNWNSGRGVYKTMRLGLLWSLAAVSMWAQAPGADPIQQAVSAFNSALTDGRIKDAVAQRKLAADLLERMPVGAPQFPMWVRHVAELFRQSGLTRQSREIVQAAVERTEHAAGSSEARTSLLTTMAEFWQQDGNPLKALESLEKAAAALEAAGLADPHNPEIGKVMGFISTGQRLQRVTRSSQAIGVYRTLAEINQRLGRRDAMAAFLAKIRALAGEEDESLADFYEGLGLKADAEALFRVAVNRAQSQGDRADALGSLAAFYSRTQRFPEAVSALEQAVHPAPEWQWRQSLAEALRNAGRTEDAERVSQDAAAAASATAVAFGDAVISHRFEPVPAPESFEARIGKAQETADQGQVDEALALLSLLDGASSRDHRGWMVAAVPQLAGKLAEKGATKQAGHLFQRALAIMAEWSPVEAGPQLELEGEYVRFLISQRDRWSDVPTAIEHCRALAVAAEGADSNDIAGVFELSLEFESQRGSRTGTATAAREYLQLEERLSGTTSEPYLEAIQKVVEFVQLSGDNRWELELRRKAVEISDVVYGAKDERTAAIRLPAALAFARNGRHDEAERMAREAVEIGKGAREFIDALEEIRKMRRAGA